MRNRRISLGCEPSGNFELTVHLSGRSGIGPDWFVAAVSKDREKLLLQARELAAAYRKQGFVEVSDLSGDPLTPRLIVAPTLREFRVGAQMVERFDDGSGGYWNGRSWQDVPAGAEPVPASAMAAG
jgi:hypothetical protein